jgi:hypothetical protein
MEKVDAFIEQWTEDSPGTKSPFIALYKEISNYDRASFEFHDRPGISYSLRVIHDAQKDRPLFVMIDVIDDDPTQRWLSVCFYGDMIEDPEELGDLIPEGLLGADGYCFDITGPDAKLQAYVSQRIQEAYTRAGNGP